MRRAPRSTARRARLLAGVLLVGGGGVAVADAAVTVAWQEPVGAIQAVHNQRDLAGRYATLQARYARTRLVSSHTTMLARAHTAGRLDRATPSGSPLGKLRIPRIGLDLVWVQGTDTASLAKAPGHYVGTALPGRRGTVGIAGHRSTHGAPFRHIDRLRPGDPIDVSMPYGSYRYVVERTRIVSPEQAEVLRTAHSDRLVLTACHPVWSAAQRIVVISRLVRWPGALGSAPPLTSTPGELTMAEARAALADAPRLTRAPRRAAS